MNRVKMVNWLMAVAGLLVALSPFILGYWNVMSAMWNGLIVGVLVIILAVMVARSEDMENDKTLDLITTVLGVWLISSPFVLGFSETAAAMQSYLLAGVAIYVLGVWSLRMLNELAPESTWGEDLRE